jgi:hypothetical protein
MTTQKKLSEAHKLLEVAAAGLGGAARWPGIAAAGERS